MTLFESVPKYREKLTVCNLLSIKPLSVLLAKPMIQGGLS
jgi:hypothetical protein